MNNARKILGGAAVATVLASGGTLVATGTAHAATNPPCITRTEFGRVHHGMTLTQVRRIVGGTGKISLSSSFMTIRDFKTCTPWHVSNMTFQGGRVTSKLYI